MKPLLVKLTLFWYSMWLLTESLCRTYEFPNPVHFYLTGLFLWPSHLGIWLDMVITTHKGA